MGGSGVVGRDRPEPSTAPRRRPRRARRTPRSRNRCSSRRARERPTCRSAPPNARRASGRGRSISATASASSPRNARMLVTSRPRPARHSSSRSDDRHPRDRGHARQTRPGAPVRRQDRHALGGELRRVEPAGGDPVDRGAPARGVGDRLDGRGHPVGAPAAARQLEARQRLERADAARAEHVLRLVVEHVEAGTVGETRLERVPPVGQEVLALVDDDRVPARPGAGPGARAAAPRRPTRGTRRAPRAPAGSA